MHTICAVEKQKMQDDICLILGKIQKPLIERRGNSFLQGRNLAFQNRKKYIRIFIELYTVNLECLKLLVSLPFHQQMERPGLSMQTACLTIQILKMIPYQDHWCHEIDKSQLNCSSPLVEKLPVVSSRLCLSGKAKSVPAKDE